VRTVQGATDLAVSAPAARSVLGYEPAADILATAAAWKAKLHADTRDTQARAKASQIDRHQKRAELISHWNEYMEHLQSTFGCSHEKVLAMLSQETKLQRAAGVWRPTSENSNQAPRIGVEEGR
jgi:hypothetical protein